MTAWCKYGAPTMNDTGHRYRHRTTKHPITTAALFRSTRSQTNRPAFRSIKIRRFADITKPLLYSPTGHSEQCAVTTYQSLLNADKISPTHFMVWPRNYRMIR